MAKAKMQKMRKMQKTQKMKKLRKMQKTRKMKGGFGLSSLKEGLSKASEYGKEGLSKASELGKEYGNKALSKASEMGSDVYAQGSELGNKALSKASEMGSDVYAQGSAMASDVYKKGSAMFEKAKNKTVEKFLEKLNSALEKGEERLKGFLEKMGVDESDIDGAIEAISEGNMEALKNNKGLQKLMDEIKTDPKEFAKKAAAVKEELPEAQAVEVSADAVLAEVVDEVKDAEAEVVDAEAEVVDAEEVEEKLGGGMIKNTIDDLFVLVAFIFTFGPVDGVSKWSSYMSVVANPDNRMKMEAMQRRAGMRGGKRNKPVKSRKNRKSKKSKSAKKH